MSAGPAASLLPDGRRLHLHHGPIDLIVEAWGPEREACYAQAVRRFDTVLTGLVAELTALRAPLSARHRFSDPIARRMASAVARYPDVFVTPMAAVAGAVADEILEALVSGRDVPKAYVNNGGDIAFHLTAGERVSALGPAGTIEIAYGDAASGLATSGAGGRSHSLGIADAVTVAARSAADADVAATLIANAVDLPGHPAITRVPASELAPDSDLGDRLVTTAVGALSDEDIETALDRGEAVARRYRSEGNVLEAVLSLRSHCRIVTATKPLHGPLPWGQAQDAIPQSG
ncbi:MAG: UPF0280 family protein [Alphaproteobacteria bacterium]